MIFERRRIGLVPLAAVLLVACTIAGTDQGRRQAASSSPAPPIVYAVVGASDSVGVGASDPVRDAWPQVLFRSALPESAVMYNFGVPGATVASALTDEVPEALSVEPTLITVWLNVNDLIAGVGPSDYESEFEQLVHALRRGGSARVLIANTPYLDRLPVYLDCRAGTARSGVACPPSLAQTSTEALDAAVSAYNSAIANVARREGAILVDLHAQGEVPDAHPDWVSSDGFHPSTAGYAAIAATFAATLREASTAPA